MSPLGFLSRTSSSLPPCSALCDHRRNPPLPAPARVYPTCSGSLCSDPRGGHEVSSLSRENSESFQLSCSAAPLLRFGTPSTTKMRSRPFLLAGCGPVHRSKRGRLFMTNFPHFDLVWPSVLICVCFCSIYHGIMQAGFRSSLAIPRVAVVLLICWVLSLLAL